MDRGIPKCHEKNPSQCHFVHHKYWPGIELRASVVRGSDKLCESVAYVGPSSLQTSTNCHGIIRRSHCQKPPEPLLVVGCTLALHVQAVL
jgi:hypothetical protein